MTSSPEPIFIGIIGVGGVGQHVISQLSDILPPYRHVHCILISSSKKSLYISPDQAQKASLDLSQWQKNLQSSTQPPLNPQQVLSYLKSLPGRGVLIDNTSAEAVVSIYPACLASGISVVTPNKKAFASTFSFWQEIFSAAYSPAKPSGGYIYHESSVGACLPIISTLKDLVATGDKVLKIEGVFSGTMSFLFNNFSPLEGQSGKWSEEVKKAKELGYTEPDPRDDLNGADVARKLVILARLVGLEVESIDAFPVQSLIPKELEGVSSGQEFLEKLPKFDEEMEKVKTEAEKEGKVVRFVGSIDFEGKKLKVGLERLGREHPIAGLKGSASIVNFYTARYGANPLVIKGQGAGGALTAMGVTSDLLKVLQLLH